jgi:hypothetical protein
MISGCVGGLDANAIDPAMTVACAFGPKFDGVRAGNDPIRRGMSIDSPVNGLIARNANDSPRG